jgi:hypothetical protein
MHRQIIDVSAKDQSAPQSARHCLILCNGDCGLTFIALKINLRRFDLGITTAGKLGRIGLKETPATRRRTPH